MLIPRPHHVRMCYRSRVSCSCKEKYFPFFPTLCHRFLIQFSPDSRPLVMNACSIFTAVKYSVHWQIFSKVCHPSTHAKADHIFFYQLFIPCIGFRICKIYHSRRKCSNRHQIIFAFPVFDTIAMFRCISIEFFFNCYKRVYITQKTHSLLFPCDYFLIQSWVKVLLPLPIPHNLIAKACTSAS